LKKKKTPIRAVIDTNLFISGLLAGQGPTSKLQDLWASEVFELAVSEEILQEIKKTLQKPYLHKMLFIFEGEEDEIIELIRGKAHIVTQDFYKTDRITSDPTDNKFLACALEAQADYIVSGDNHLLSIKHYHGIQIVDAKTFIKIVRGK
jgi:uncharacterized protein